MRIGLVHGIFAAAICCLFLPSASVAQEKQSPSENNAAVADAKTTLGIITPPRAIYTPDPEYSKDAHKEGVEGTVILVLMNIQVHFQPFDNRP